MKYKGFAFLVLCTFVFNVNAMAQTKRANKVLKLLEKYDAVWKTKDVKTASKILSSNYVYFGSTGNISNRQQTLDTLKSADYKIESAERSEIKTFRTGNTIVVSSRWKGNGTYKNDEFNDNQRCGLVFVKDGKQWKIVSENCSNIKKKS